MVVSVWGVLWSTKALSNYISSCSPFSLRAEKTWLMLPQVGVTEDRKALGNSLTLRTVGQRIFVSVTLHSDLTK